MKAKLLFTAALMAAMAVSQNETRAYTPMPSQLGVYATAEPLAEGEEVGEETLYENCLVNQACNENTPGWIKNVSQGNDGYLVNTPDINSDVYSGPGIEFFDWADENYVTGDLVWQTAWGLPAGLYRVSGYATGRSQGAGGDVNVAGLYFFANDAQMQVTSNKFQAVSVETRVGLDGLKVGLTASEQNQNNWVVLSQIRVALLNTAASLQAAYEAAMTYNETIQDEVLNEAIAKAKGLVGTLTTNAEFHDAIMELNEAFNACIARHAETNPLVFTGDNLDFSDQIKKMSGWTVNGSVPGGGAYGGCEIYNASSEVSRTMNVQNGQYRVSLQARANQNGEFLLYAQDLTGEVSAPITQVTDDNAPGEGSVYDRNMQAMNDAIEDASTWTSVTVNLTDGVLAFGLRQTNNNGVSWAVYNGFKVEYLGESSSALKEAFETLKAEAGLFLSENDVPSACEAALEACMNKDTSGFVDADYIAATNELRSRLETAESLVAPYASYIAMKAMIEEANEGTVAEEAVKTALSEAIASADTQVEAAMAADVLSGLVETLQTAGRTYVASVTGLAEGVTRVDMTFMLNTPDVTGLPKAVSSTYGWISSTNSWSNNFNNNGDPSQFYESYRTGGGFAAGEWVLYQTVNLPAGDYRVSLRAFGQNANGQGSGPLVASVYAGETKGESIADSRTLDNVYDVWFEHEMAGDIQLGVRPDEGNGANWIGCNDMKLYMVAATDLSLDEASATYGVEDDTFANVTLTRALKAESWNTFCVPFDMTAEQLAANGITDVRALESASVEGTSVTLNFSESNVNAVEAGVPYLVKVTGYDGTINVENAVMAAAPGAVTVDGVTMTGNYAASTVPVGAYFISNNAFYYADEASNVALKGFRAYIQLNNGVQNANRLMINLDGEVTGIEDVLGEEAAEADKLVNVVSLDGMTVKAGVKKAEALDGLQKGIYIVDGKKYVVK